MFFSITFPSNSSTPSKIPCTSSDSVDSLPDIGDLLREFFDTLDEDEAVLVEDEEYGEDVKSDEELLPAQVAGDPCRRCRSWICEDPDVRPVLG